MSYLRNDEITRDGFVCSYGRFYAEPGRVERLEGSTLQSIFLPKLTADGRQKLSTSSGDDFVRGQLKHYGVSFSEDEISGKGTLLLQKVLQAGMCDTVPGHIAQLREQMHAEWLNKLSPEQLSNHPEWAIERYFLSSGRPDRTKTTVVVGIPLDRYSSYRASQMRKAASEVPGLHQETGFGPKTQTVFMGWDSAAVGKAAKDHARDEAAEEQAAQSARASERAGLHANYLQSLEQKKRPNSLKVRSPVGSYIIDCEEIEDQWPDQADNLTLDIRETGEPGIFEASFDFGVLEGVMIICAEKAVLEKYYSRLDREEKSDLDDYYDDDSEDDGEDEDEDEEDEDEEDEDEKDEDEDEEDEDEEDEASKMPSTSSKRKVGTSQDRSCPPKKSKLGSQPHTYVLKLKCRETGEGEIQYDAEKGTIEFEDDSLAAFAGKADLPCVGQGVPFTGRKIADSPSHRRQIWADFSAAQHEYERVARWR